jgi:hypothetical protein
VVATRPRRTSAKAITYVVLKEFAGGISSHPDKVNMPQGFTPMARNVEWLSQGGLYVRKGVGSLVYGAAGAEMAAPGAVPVRFFHYVRDPTNAATLTSQYMVACDNGRIRVGVDFGPLVTGTAGTWMDLQLAGQPLVTIGPPSFTAWDTKVYLSIGNAATNALGASMVRYDGAASTAMGKAWANDYAAPTGGNMPTGRYTAAWAERLWAACMVPDTGPIEGSTIRWSHPGRPEDWAQSDYIVVGQQGDTITGIAPMRDMLVVFKRSSMYALLGSGSTNFRVVELSATIGCTGEFTRDDQGSVCFWDSTLGLCKFDGKKIDNIFAPLLRFMAAGVGGSITRCGGVVTDGEKIYVGTDFQDFYGQRVPDISSRSREHNPVDKGPAVEPRTGAPLDPGSTTWGQFVADGVTWSGTAGIRWLRVSTEFFNIVWVFRPGAGWTSYSLNNPRANDITMLGQVRARLNAAGDIDSNRRIVYGLSNGTEPIFMSDRYDDGTDRWRKDEHQAIDAFYMTPWLHGGLPAGNKKWRAPHVIQEADQKGNLLIDVYYDFNYDNLRRSLRVGVALPLSFDSFSVGKPGTIGRARAVMLLLRPEVVLPDLPPRHWGISSITIPLNPKTMR